MGYLSVSVIILMYLKVRSTRTFKKKKKKLGFQYWDSPYIFFFLPKKKIILKKKLLFFLPKSSGGSKSPISLRKYFINEIFLIDLSSYISGFRSPTCVYKTLKDNSVRQ